MSAPSRRRRLPRRRRRPSRGLPDHVNITPQRRVACCEGNPREAGSVNASYLANGLVGGWEIDDNARFQSGLILTFQNVRPVSMNDQELQKIYKIYKVPDSTGKTRIYMLPSEFIQNTINAFNTSATTATGYASTPPTGAYFAPPNGRTASGRTTACARRSTTLSGARGSAAST